MRGSQVSRASLERVMQRGGSNPLEDDTLLDSADRVDEGVLMVSPEQQKPLRRMAKTIIVTYCKASSCADTPRLLDLGTNSNRAGRVESCVRLGLVGIRRVLRGIFAKVWPSFCGTGQPGAMRQTSISA